MIDRLTVLNGRLEKLRDVLAEMERDDPVLQPGERFLLELKVDRKPSPGVSPIKSVIVDANVHAKIRPEKACAARQCRDGATTAISEQDWDMVLSICDSGPLWNDFRAFLQELRRNENNPTAGWPAYRNGYLRTFFERHRLHFAVWVSVPARACRDNRAKYQLFKLKPPG